MAVKVTLKPSHAPRWLEYVAVASILIIALITRTYNLEAFPYFPSDYPWLGDAPGPAGLYRDEANYLAQASNLFHDPTIYQPWLHLLFIKLAVDLLGENVLAARLPSALASSLTAVMVYLIAKRKFGRAPALISSLYFIAMTPALIYNRMAFLENSVALFFTSSIYSLLRYEEEKRRRWLYAAGLLALAAAFSKINGLVAPLFLILYLARLRREVSVFKPVLAMIIACLAFPSIAVGLKMLEGHSLITSVQVVTRQWSVGQMGREMSTWQYLFLCSMPSGYMPPLSTGYLRPEFWYLFSYFCLGYLAFRSPRKVLDVAIAIMLFITMSFMVWGLSSYHITAVQPFMSIPVGPSILQLLDANPLTLPCFLVFLYAPLAVTFLIETFQLTSPTFNNSLYIVKLCLVGLPLLAAFIMYALGLNSGRKQITLSALSILAFILLLLIGSYVVPALYPHYFKVTP